MKLKLWGQVLTIISPKISPKIHWTSFQKSIKNGPKINQKWSQNHEKYDLGAKSMPNRTRSAPGRLLFRLIWTVQERLLLLWPTFKAPREISGAISGPQENRKSAQNRTFGPRLAQGPSKNVVLSWFLGSLKNVSFFGWFFGSCFLVFSIVFRTARTLKSLKIHWF